MEEIKHVFKLPQEYSFERAGIAGKKFPISDLTNSTGVLIIDTEKGHETTIIEHECDFIYYILEGNGYFEINDKREDFIVGDLVVIPAKSKFTYKGKCKLLLINNPAFSMEQEETLN